MPCDYCEQEPIFRCCVCGKMLCGKHTTLATLCPSCKARRKIGYSINKLRNGAGGQKIREFVCQFWGEEIQRTFDRDYEVLRLPMYLARSGKNIIGFISFSVYEHAILIVTLGVLPQYQGLGVGRALIKKVETHAKRTGRKKLILSTSNDDLPALAFYQSIGFQIYDVKPNVIAKKHSKIIKGICGLPVRDELRLQKLL
jgi:ribosomal protein S18 acetylase RimI-like enzyme